MQQSYNTRQERLKISPFKTIFSNIDTKHQFGPETRVFVLSVWKTARQVNLDVKTACVCIRSCLCNTEIKTHFTLCLLPRSRLFMCPLHTAFASQPNTPAALCFVASSSILIANSGHRSEVASLSISVAGMQRGFVEEKEGVRRLIKVLYVRRR